MDATLCAPLAPGTRVGGWQIAGLVERTPYLCRYRAEDGRRRVILQELLPQAFVLRDGDGIQPHDPEDRTTLRWWLRAYLDRAHAFAALPLPGMAQVFDAFEANGTAYAVLEPLQGEALSERLRMRGLMAWDEYLVALRPVVDALTRLHAQNLVLRDLSPAQLVLRSNGTLAISAFGPLRAAVRFRRQTLISTLPRAYAAPEELGAGAAIGPWTDLYNLAASSAQVLAGRTPVDGDPASLADLFTLPDPMPAATRAVLQAMLNPVAEQRPAAGALLRSLPGSDVAAPFAGEAGSGAAATTAPLARRIGLVAVGGIAVLGLALWLWLRTPAPEAEPAASTANALTTAPVATTPATEPAAPVAPDRGASLTAVAETAPASTPSPAGTGTAAKATAAIPAPRIATASPPPAAAVTSTGVRASDAAASPPITHPAAMPETASVKPDSERFAVPNAPLAVTITTPTLNVAPASKPAVDAQAERQRLAAAHAAELAAERKQCKTPISALLGDRPITYADLSTMKGVEHDSGGQLRLPHVATDDGRHVSLRVDPHGCVVDVHVD
ncbi:serine/threonine protein kinase [Solimonas terrae]|uniref:Protein kinase domain-containing protein n=1 Tax=Solimonas terrae TaxID=1396819 RepID=A0A6M2BVN1_9GAMM|nr:hypothetical protein [Solimonas terrae]NGY06420.1 hypothetical protein [Solimonas terrae]